MNGRMSSMGKKGWCEPEKGKHGARPENRKYWEWVPEARKGRSGTVIKPMNGVDRGAGERICSPKGRAGGDLFN